jgi:type I restriction enzyme M protein
MADYSIHDILKDSSYALDIFTDEEKNSLEIFDKRGKPYIKDFIDQSDRPAKPEEIVRQLFLYRLKTTYGYVSSRIALEKGVQFGSTIGEKRADIVIYDKNDRDTAYIIVEVKKPKRKDGIEQLKSYCNAEGAPIAVWTNGSEVVILHRADPNLYQSIPDIPHANQTLAEVINEQVTIDELSKTNKLVTERLSLKDVIESLEDLVLANAGVDAFDEVFKLIYAKLYDEWAAENSPTRKRLVQFRAAGQTYQELYDKINGLFKDAAKQWSGVFLPGEKIDLRPEHLAVCVSFLQDIKLFNSNLQVIDEAFEYLVTQVSKGSKGQYFTPRHVIDMAVKMLNPKWEEFVIDTAAGSCGFTMHSIFHIWGGELSSRKPEEWQRSYASEKVYAIDFDARSVKISKAVNLIAGDGRTNVYKANTLDPRTWDDGVKIGLRPLLTNFDDHIVDEDNQKSYRFFNFDVLLTNPPFAGDIKETRILHQYDIAKKSGGRWENKVGRDVLFIERNLQFVKPGGRLAIVLPQGRFNNVSDEYIRKFVAKHCRILGIVSLHPNTFRPHTGAKTSVLFLQKWNDDPEKGQLCKFMEDYPIFFASSEHGGKDNSGEYVYLKDSEGNDLLDLYGHKIVDHDLFNSKRVLDQQLENLLKHDSDDIQKCDEHRKMHKRLVAYVPNRPTITEAFIAFAQNEKLGFHEGIGAKSSKKSPVGYEQRYSEAQETGRFDAEYYHPRYQKALDLMGKSGKSIKDVAVISKIKFRPIPGETFEYIEIGNVREDGFANSTTVDGLEAPSRAQWIVKTGDVITSTVRPIRRLTALIEPEQDGFVCSSGFAVLRPIDIEPELLFAYLKLPLVCEILDLYTTASMYPAVSVSDILNLPIPDFDSKVKKRLIKLVQDAREKRIEVRRILQQVGSDLSKEIWGEGLF